MHLGLHACFDNRALNGCLFLATADHGEMQLCTLGFGSGGSFDQHRQPVPGVKGSDVGDLQRGLWLWRLCLKGTQLLTLEQGYQFAAIL